MVTLLGQRWEHKHGANPSPEWQRLLAPYTHLDPRQCAAQIVKRLVPNARGEVWPPEMADVIVMLTPRPEDYGMPATEQAFQAACRQHWSLHAAVYEAARRVGVFELRNGEAKRRDFDPVYAQVCEEFIAGRTESWQQPGQLRFALADDRQPKHPAWMEKYSVPPSFDFKAALRMLGPMPKPLEKSEPPAPITHEEFLERQIDSVDLQLASKRYRGGAA